MNIHLLGYIEGHWPPGLPGRLDQKPHSQYLDRETLSPVSPIFGKRNQVKSSCPLLVSWHFVSPKRTFYLMLTKKLQLQLLRDFVLQNRYHGSALVPLGDFDPLDPLLCPAPTVEADNASGQIALAYLEHSVGPFRFRVRFRFIRIVARRLKITKFTANK